MMGHREKLISGSEYDALACHKHYHWAAGVRKAIKRAFNKRVRKATAVYIAHSPYDAELGRDCEWVRTEVRQ